MSRASSRTPCGFNTQGYQEASGEETDPFQLRAIGTGLDGSGGGGGQAGLQPEFFRG